MVVEQFHQPCTIENRTGGGTNIATEVVVRAPPDGYTLLLATAANAVKNRTLYERLNFNFLRDIAPVAGNQSRAADSVGEPVGSDQFNS